MGLEELVGLVRRGGLDRRDGNRGRKWKEENEMEGGERDGRGRTDELD